MHIHSKNLNCTNNSELLYTDVNDIKIAYKQFGSGKPLLLITGYATTADIWPPLLIRRLSANHKVIVFDNRGAGFTTSGTKSFSIEQFAKDVAGFMDSLNIQKANLLGWSMGGMIALEFAKQYPEKIEKLIVYAAGCGGEKTIQPEPEVVNELTTPTNSSNAECQKMYKLMFPEKWRNKFPEDHHKKIFPHINKSVNLETIKKQGLAIYQWPGIYGKLLNYRKSTLILFGEDDIIVPVANGKILQTQCIDSRLVIVPESGHGLIFQDTEYFSEIVLNFLAE